MDIFIGGGGDDLTFLDLGVLAAWARRYAAETGRPVLIVPNARTRRVRPAISAAARTGEPVSLIGHSWGGPDAWRATAWAARAGLPVRCLITLDPVGGPLRRGFEGRLPVPWLNVEARPSSPDRSDRVTSLWPWARKPSGLPVALATRHVALDLNHWNVAGMMTLGGARQWLDGQASRSAEFSAMAIVTAARHTADHGKGGEGRHDHDDQRTTDQ